MADKKPIAKIAVDRDLCIGSANCMALLGEVFDLDHESKAVIVRRSGAKDSGPVDRGELAHADVTDEQLLEAAQACPTKAIVLFDEDGKQVYP